MVGSTVGRYQIVERLGGGGMGEVFLARDSRLRRKVALKTLNDRQSSDPKSRQRLVHEAQLAARLSHPNIATIYDVIEADEHVHIVMEYVRGATLAQQIQHGPIPLPRALEIAAQLADALAEAHAAGVVHGDVKPANVAVTSHGKVKVLDFGLARAIQHSDVSETSEDKTPERPSRELETGGTPPYMAPEQFRGERLSEHTDIFSAGVTIYEMLTGRKPFGEPDPRIQADFAARQAPRVGAIYPELPAEVDEVVAKAMALDPRARHPSAAALRDDLRRAADVLPSETTLSHVAVQVRAAFARARPMAAPFLAVGALLAGVIGYQARKWIPATEVAKAPSPMVAVLQLSEPPGSTGHFAAGLTDVLIAGLGRLSGTQVLSSEKARAYWNKPDASGQLARAFRVEYVVQGAIQRIGETLRVTLELVRTDSGFVVWGDTLDGTLSELFALQDEVTKRLGAALRVQVRPASRGEWESLASSDPDALMHYSDALAMRNRPDVPGNVDRAISLLETAVRKDRDFALAHAALAELYWAKYEETTDDRWPSKAREAMREALRLDKAGLPSVRCRVAYIHFKTGRKQEAIDELRAVVNRDPEHEDSLLLLGQYLFETGQKEEGIDFLERATRVRKYWGAYQRLGATYLNAGKNALAIGAFEKVNDLQPDTGWGYEGLGAAYHALGQPDKALDNYRKALERGRTNAYVYGNTGALLLEQKRFRNAVEMFEQAARLEPSPIQYANLGDGYSGTGELGKAQDSYRQAIDLAQKRLQTNPSDADWLSRIAVYQVKVGLHQEAERNIAKALDVAPRSAAVRHREAVVFALAGRLDRSVQALSVALEHGYSVARAEADMDLEAIRTRREYQELIAKSGSERRLR